MLGRGRFAMSRIVDARVCRNFRQLASVRRSGAGGIFRALRIRRIVDALTRWPSLSSSPWIRWDPQHPTGRQAPLSGIAAVVITSLYHTIIHLMYDCMRIPGS